MQAIGQGKWLVLMLSALATGITPMLADAQAWPRPQWHLQVEVGTNRLDLTEPDYRIYQTNDAFAIRAGYKVNDQVSLVGGYIDMGRFHTVLFGEEGDDIEDTPNGVIGFRDTAATAFTAHAEISREFFGFLHPTAGLGVARWRLDLPDGEHDDTQDTAALVRLGLGFDVGEATRLDLGIQRIGGLDVNTAGLALRFDF